MRVQAIDDENPFRGGVTRDGALHMAHKILFGSGRPYGRRHDLPGCDLKIGDQRLSPMTNVFKFHAFHQAWLHGTCGLRAFIGLNAGLLVGAHDMHPVFMQLGRLLIQLADSLDVGVKLFRVLGSVVIEPIARLMRFQVRFFLKSGRCCAAKCWGQCHG